MNERQQEAQQHFQQVPESAAQGLCKQAGADNNSSGQTNELCIITAYSPWKNGMIAGTLTGLHVDIRLVCEDRCGYHHHTEGNAQLRHSCGYNAVVMCEADKYRRDHRRHKINGEPPTGEYIAVVLTHRKIPGIIRRYAPRQEVQIKPGMRSGQSSDNAENRPGNYHADP